MQMPCKPTTLSVEQITELNRRLSEMRHNINNHLSTMTLAAELARLKPETVGDSMQRLLQQIPKIRAEITAFSAVAERTLGIDNK